VIEKSGKISNGITFVKTTIMQLVFRGNKIPALVYFTMLSIAQTGKTWKDEVVDYFKHRTI
jgi:hypothetical protein